MLAVALPIAVELTARPAAAEDGSKRCRGGKQYYQGQCRYPDEIQRLQAEAARQRAAEAARRKAAQERKAAEKAAEEKKARDVVACASARQADSLAEWEKYLTDFADGMCAQEAKERIAALTRKEPVTPSPTAPAVPPVTEPTADDDAGGEPSPLVWIGLGVGAAGLITFGVAGGIAMHRESKLSDACPDQSCAPDREADLDSAMLAAHVSTVGLVVGGIGVSLLAIGLALPDSDDAEEPAATEPTAKPDTGAEPASVHLLVGPGSLGLRGRF